MPAACVCKNKASCICLLIFVKSLHTAVSLFYNCTPCQGNLSASKCLAVAFFDCGATWAVGFHGNAGYFIDFADPGTAPICMVATYPGINALFGEHKGLVVSDIPCKLPRIV